jgi:8-oxo-dGTP pyrophosphatase MutT (NUDIX family)
MKKDTEKCASIVLFNKLDEVLILFRSPHLKQWMPGKWSTPGGHLWEGEEEKAGAARELFEETGLFVPLESLSLVERRGRMAFYTSEEFYGRIVVDEYENTGYVWASEGTLNKIDGVPQLLHTIGAALQKRKENS